MNDRYRDRRDAYGDGQYDRYGTEQRGGDRQRSSRTSADRYSNEAEYADYASYGRQSGGYRTSGSSTGAGAYSSNYRAQGRDAGYQPSQGSGSRHGRHPNMFEDYYPDDSVESYRRSAYGTGTSRSAAAAHRASSPAQPPMQPVVPAQTRHAAHGSHSRSGAEGAYAPKKRSRKRPVIIALVVVLAVVLVGAGAAWAYVTSISNNLHEGVDQDTLDALEPATPTATSLGDAPFYMLLLGVDMDEERAKDEEYDFGGSARSDSMILARIDPINKKVALISIHRDTMIDMGEYGEQKINAAFQYFGAAGAIQAVSKMAGVPISHYASIDFDGFSAMVNALGGVEVNVPLDINDEVMNVHLNAGQQTLNGDDALILCRSRHAYDDVANDGDVMRAANQRMVLGAIAKKALSSDLLTIANTVQTMSRYATTDLEISDIVGLAQLFQGVDPSKDIYTAMEPTTSAYINDTWYEYLDEPAWKEMVARMDKGLPPVNKTEIDSATGTVLSTGGSDAPVV